MTELSVTLCGQTTTIACAPEDEARLRHLLGIIQERTDSARAIVGDNDRWRQMLFAAIFLADELDGGEGATATAPSGAPRRVANDADATRVMALATRINAALDRIEGLPAGG